MILMVVPRLLSIILIYGLLFTMLDTAQARQRGAVSGDAEILSIR